MPVLVSGSCRKSPKKLVNSGEVVGEIPGISDGDRPKGQGPGRPFFRVFSRADGTDHFSKILKVIVPKF